MSDDSLLTLKQLAQELGLPESTVRYYRDAFLDQIPSIGTGRRRRYPPQAVAVLRSIAASYGAGRSRAEIVAGIERQGGSAAIAAPAAQTAGTRALDDVTNLDLLAAILDGEREQRDALWQMAKEIVRLTDVLAGQDTVLGQIAERAGVATGGLLTGGTPATQALGPGRPAAGDGAAGAAGGVAGADEPGPRAADRAAASPSPAPAVATGRVTDSRPLYASMTSAPAAPAPSTGPSSGAPAAGAVAASAGAAPPRPAVAAAPAAETGTMAALRAELEAERQLVERLREAKLQLEHRAAGAEAELEVRGRRSSVIRRLLGSEDE